MGRSIIDLISSKIELFRLEQRYTKRRNRRSTFVSEAQYVDGEYIYPYSPTSPKRQSVVQFGSHEAERSQESGFDSHNSSAATSPTSMSSSSSSPTDSDGEGRSNTERTESVVGRASAGSGVGAGRKGRWNSARAFGRRTSVMNMSTVQEKTWEGER